MTVPSATRQGSPLIKLGLKNKMQPTLRQLLETHAVTTQDTEKSNNLTFWCCKGSTMRTCIFAACRVYSSSCRSTSLYSFWANCGSCATDGQFATDRQLGNRREVGQQTVGWAISGQLGSRRAATVPSSLIMLPRHLITRSHSLIILPFTSHHLDRSHISPASKPWMAPCWAASVRPRRHYRTL